MTRIPLRPAVTGVLAAFGVRALVLRAILIKLRADVRSLNAGDAGPLLKMYTDEAVLRFNEGDHRWAGVHQGKPAIERFLANFTGAGVQGEIIDLWTSGPPWALKMVVRFDDRAIGPDGQELYANRTCLVISTRWGRIVHHEDFYEDTGRILEFERRLTALGNTGVA